MITLGEKKTAISCNFICDPSEVVRDDDAPLR